MNGNNNRFIFLGRNGAFAQDGGILGLIHIVMLAGNDRIRFPLHSAEKFIQNSFPVQCGKLLCQFKII